MPFCKRCGLPLKDNHNYCSQCGAPVNGSYPDRVPAMEAPYAADRTYRPAAPAYRSGNPALPYMIWSVILFFCLNVIGTPLAVAAALYAAMANDPACERPEEKRNNSKLLCIAATVIDAITFLLMITLLVLHLISYKI